MKETWLSRAGVQHWYFAGLPHREDGPAEIWTDGTQRWYQNGKPHREDGPAQIYPSGTQYWYRNGRAAPRRWPCSDPALRFISLRSKRV